MRAAENRRFAECVAEVLKHEGGFVNHSRDPGGATNMGITLRTFRDWRGDENLDVEDLRKLTVAEAREIYFARYWNPVRGDELPPGVDLAVFDFAVNSGVGRAVRVLQSVLGVVVDGAVGRQTLNAVRSADAADLIEAICKQRLDFLRRLPTWNVFGRGWERRVKEVEKAAMARVGKPVLTIREAIATDTGRAASAMAIITSIASVLPQTAPVIEALGKLAPVVTLVLIAATLLGVWLWRRGRT